MILEGTIRHPKFVLDEPDPAVVAFMNLNAGDDASNYPS